MDILWIVLLSPYVGLIAAVQWCQKQFCGLSDGEDIEMGTTIPWSRHVPRYERVRSSDTGGSDVSACGAGKSSEQRGKVLDLRRPESRFRDCEGRCSKPVHSGWKHRLALCEKSLTPRVRPVYVTYVSDRSVYEL